MTRTQTDAQMADRILGTLTTLVVAYRKAETDAERDARQQQITGALMVAEAQGLMPYLKPYIALNRALEIAAGMVEV